MRRLNWSRYIRPRKTISLLILVALPLFSFFHFVSSANAVPTELSLLSVEDTYVDSASANTNYGKYSWMEVELRKYTYSNDQYSNAYIKFDVSAVPAEAIIAYARLELYCWFLTGVPDVGAHYGVDDLWNENTTTWNNAPSFAPEPTEVVRISNASRWYAWNVTSIVDSALDFGTLTVVLKVESASSLTSEADFRSKENYSNKPRLTIGYTLPISCSASPSAIAVGGSVMVSGCIAIPRFDTVQMTYTRPDKSTIDKDVATNSSGYFTDLFTPDVVGVWSVTAHWNGAEGYNASTSTDMFVVTEETRDSWAIIIGVKDYKYVDDLDYPDRDAMELYDKLKEAWPEDHLKLLTNEQANKSGIESAIKDWLAPRETKDSVVLFFFSGHGCSGSDVAPIDEADGKDEYISPYDSSNYSYDYDIRDDTLDAWFSSLDSQHITVFLDSCFSGGFIDKGIKGDSLLSARDDGLAKDMSKTGRVIITACSETESSYEYPSLQNGVFTYYMLQSLNNLTATDSNRDNEISAEEIFYYAEPEIRNFTGNKQHPQMYDGYEGQLKLMTVATISLDTNPFKASIIVDGLTYTPPVSFVWFLYTKHTIEVPQQVRPSYEGTRYLFTSWNDGSDLKSRVIFSSGDESVYYLANYQAQYYLAVSSDFGEPQGAGWYDLGAVASFGVNPLFDFGNGTRVVFAEWLGDVNSTNPNPTTAMDAPKRVVAQWRMQYYLTVSSDYGEPQGAGWYDVGSTASLNVTSVVDFLDGERVVFIEWSGDISSTDPNSNIMMDRPKQVSTQWKTQFWLSMGVDPSGIVSMSGEGWCDKGSQVVTETAPSIVNGSTGTRYVFENWKVGDMPQDGNNVSVFMDSFHSAVACYKTQYYLTTVSQYGQHQGEGWYDRGSEATFSVTSPQGLIIQKVFAGWKGDSTSTSTSTTVLMDGPKTVTGQWRDEYIPLHITIIVAGAAVTAGASVVIWHRRKNH